jgi:ubiquinone/menaquinone biosynthesis C-methylase UbiE
MGVDLGGNRAKKQPPEKPALPSPRERNADMSTALDRPADLAALKRRQQATWASGDYSAVAALIVPIAEQLVDLADLRAGSRVLDVATGSGNAAIAAAQLASNVVGVDYVDSLLERGRERAAAERLDVEFRSGDAEDLPFPDASFDAVLFVFGSMFAPNHVQTAGEIARVTRPGGTIALASWTPEGFIGALFRVVARYAPPPTGVASPALWGTADYLESLFGQTVHWTHTPKTFTFRFPSAEAFAHYFSVHYGPTLKTLEAAGDRGAEFKAELAELARRSSRLDDNGPVAIPATYLASIGARITA